LQKGDLQPEIAFFTFALDLPLLFDSDRALPWSGQPKRLSQRDL